MLEREVLRGEERGGQEEQGEIANRQHDFETGQL